MTRLFFGAFGAGVAALGWIGAGFAGNSSWLALAMTALIAAAYLAGAFELRQFRAATASLRDALEGTRESPATLGEWLQKVPLTLRDAVRLRVEGERGALPGPAMAPYLAGLLVMLGMLGTFLGMVVTFKGTVFALERSADLQAMRAALADPIRGLGLSFGTSVAGVAASAALGLMAAIARRERIDAARKLDALVAGVLLPFSLVHQRQESFRAMQDQARALPQLVDKLDLLLERMQQRGEQMDAQMLERHAALQREVSTAYARLAQDVGASLKDSTAASARAATDAVRPVAESAMAQVAQQTERLHARLGDVAKAQVDAIAARFTASANDTASTFHDAVARAHAAQAQADSERLQAWTGSLRAMADELHARSQRAAGDAAAQQHALIAALQDASLAAGKVPQVAAGVMTELRAEMSRLGERDNVSLQERNLLMEQLRGLLQAVNAASEQQRAATDALLASAASALEQAGARFTGLLDAHASKAGDTAAHMAAGAVELAAVADAFAQSVQQFQGGNDKLVESLERMEASLRKSTARSDEQLAYYVAQAREVIDLSITSQQGLVENLRALQVQPIRTRPAQEERG